MAKRVVVLVGGFNVYHSLIDARRTLGGRCVKWLDVGSLARPFMQHVLGKADVSKIFYFSALATHLAHSKPGVVGRHQAYIRALKHAGAEIVLGKFKDKNVRCPSCRNRFVAHEEKETDVAISVKLLEVLQSDQADTVMAISGDSDLVPAVKTALELFSDREVCFSSWLRSLC